MNADELKEYESLYAFAWDNYRKLTEVWRVAKILGPHHPVGRRLLAIADRELDPRHPVLRRRQEER